MRDRARADADEIAFAALRELAFGYGYSMLSAISDPEWLTLPGLTAKQIRQAASRAAHAGKIVGNLVTRAPLVVPVDFARAFRFRPLVVAAVPERLIPG